MVMRKKFTYLGILAVLSTGLLGFNYKNDDPILKIISQLTKWKINRPQEKIHLHFDKSIYSTTEDIWFKAYIVNAEKLQLSAMSSVINVELIDGADSIKRSIKLPIAYGLATGDFELSDKLKSGNYRIRAYTNQMRNADTHYFFEKKLTIINPANTDAVGKSNAINKRKSVTNAKNNITPSEIDFQLFPEGGYMINGLMSKMAFKANDKNGLGVNIKGVIKDNLNVEIASFATMHNGMGQFLFSPESGKKYTVVITLPSGKELTTTLPIALERGIQMNLSATSKDSVGLSIQYGNLLATDKNKEIYVVAQQQGKVYYGAKTLTNDTSFVASIAKNTFPSGIVQFTLFSSSGIPLSERIIFIQNSNPIKLAVETDKQVYASREKVNISLSMFNSEDKAINGNFSVAVVEDKRTANEDEETSILSNLLLTSDLKGFVEKPNYYFTSNTALKRVHLDLLMLTQGYRRFEWKKILDNQLSETVPPIENGLTISGYLKTSNKKPLKNTAVTLFAKGSPIVFLDTLTNNEGKFSFTNLNFQDSTSFIIQALDGKNLNKAKIEIDKELIPIVTSIDIDYSEQALNIDTVVLNDIKYDNSPIKNTIMLKEVVKRTEKKVLKHSANLNGAGVADQIVTADELALFACTELWQCLQGKLNGININSTGIAYSNRSSNRIPPPMRIVLDGVLMDADYSLREIVVSQVESVEVLKSLALSSAYGANGGGGMLIITMKRGAQGSEELVYKKSPDVVSFFPKGYQVSREFYLPKYDTPKPIEEKLDLRTTLFWNPSVFTENGKTKLDFYNGDSKGIFKVIVEGITDDGSLARQTFKYEVK
jgi:hypothetical protein